MAEWETAEILDNNRSALVDVYHGAHIETATRIVKDDAIRSTLVTDCAPLINSRISVTWLTANFFDDSIYGNVQFRVLFDKIITGKEVRWIERNTQFRMTRYRFALCDLNGPLYNMTQPYDIRSDNGPLQLRSGKWFVNNQVVIELLLDDDVHRNKCKEIAFVHHYGRCRFKSKCPDKVISDAKRASYFFAYLLSSRNTDWNEAFTVKSGQTGQPELSVYARFVAEQLYAALATHDTNWNGRAAGGEAEDVVRGACALLSNRQIHDAISLVRQTKSFDEFKGALERVVANHFNVSFQFPADI